MSVRSNYKDFICEKCQKPYIPFKRDFTCPNCGNPTTDRIIYAPSVIKFLKCHKERFGQYVPDGWYTGSLIDHVNFLLFQVFDALEYTKPKKPEEYIKDWLAKAEWGDQQYLKNHVIEIALAVYEIYLVEPELRLPKKPKPSIKKIADLLISGFRSLIRLFLSSFDFVIGGIMRILGIKV